MSKLHPIDILILVIYAMGMMLMGWYYGRGQKNTDEYFSGSGRMNPVLIGVSMFATLFSTVSFLSTPGEVLNNGPVLGLTSLAAIPFYYFIVAYGIAPLYMKQRATSAYQLLESRLGPTVRTTGAVLFIMLRLMWMSTLIYFASEAILVMLDLEHRWLPVVSLLTGAIAVSYSTLGGLRAVVITDSVQFALLFGGALAVIARVTFDVGGFGWIPTSWNPEWEDQPFFSLDPTVRVTVCGSILYGSLWWICTAGGDQTAIQRFMATKDAAAARRSFLVNSIAGGAVSIVLALVGFSLLAWYQTDPARLPEGKTIADNADLLFPYFITTHLPAGLTGLVMCGLFAAAMSSVDSGVNAISAVVMTDLVEQFRSEKLTEGARVRLARWLALFTGLFVVTASSFAMQHIPGNFIEQALRSFGLLVAPIFLLFFMAMFVRFATPTGALTGSAAALATAFFIAYQDQFTGWKTLSFQWVLPCSLAVGIGVGCAVSALTGVGSSKYESRNAKQIPNSNDE